MMLLSPEYKLHLSSWLFQIANLPCFWDARSLEEQATIRYLNDVIKLHVSRSPCLAWDWRLGIY